MIRAAAGAAVALFLAFAPQTADAAGTIAPHRALYDLSLASARSSGGVVGVQGRMLFEWGDACDGWTVHQRYRMRLSQAQEDEVEIVSSLASWESKDGLRYRFALKKQRGEEPEEELRGSARLDGPGRAGRARFTRPDETKVDLPRGTMFPSAHTIEVIRRAAAKDQFFSRRVFDGSEAEPPVDVTAFIGQAKPAGGEGGRGKNLADHDSPTSSTLWGAGLGANQHNVYTYQAPRSYVRANIEGTLNVLQSAMDEGVQRERVVVPRAGVPVGRGNVRNRCHDPESRRRAGHACPGVSSKMI